MPTGTLRSAQHKTQRILPADSSLAETLAMLVRVNSVNPAYGDGGSEANLLPVLRSFFQQHQIETFEQEVFPGRHNLIARVPGRSSRKIILEAHTDTVSIKGMTIPPFDPAVRSGRLYGRGSVDTKAGLAAMMHALVAIQADAQPPACETWLAAVVDEEFTYRGVSRLCEGLEAEAAIVAEPTELRAVVATKGVVRLRIRVTGRAAHSSKPHLGINAVTHMSRLVLALEQENARLSEITHPLLGSPTLNVGVIHGGVQVNLVPEDCFIEVDRRLLPGEQVHDVLSHLDAIFERLATLHSGFHASIEHPLLLQDEALDTPADSPAARHASSVLLQLGLNPETCGVPYGSDASKLFRAGVPSIVFGPGSIDQAHAAEEFVELAQVERAAEFYAQFVRMHP